MKSFKRDPSASSLKVSASNVPAHNQVGPSHLSPKFSNFLSPVATPTSAEAAMRIQPGATAFGAPKLVETAHLLSPLTAKSRVEGGRFRALSREQKLFLIHHKLADLESRWALTDMEKGLCSKANKKSEVPSVNLTVESDWRRCNECEYKTKWQETLIYHVRVAHPRQPHESSRKARSVIPTCCKPWKWVSRPSRPR